MRDRVGTLIAAAILLGWPGRDGRPFIAASIASDRPREPLHEGTGPYTRRVTASSEEARRYFDQGLNLLYAFNHDEAARSFRQAAEIDPGCAMAWWGLAIAQGPHINRPVVTAEQARVACDALARARAESAGIPEVDRDLIEALARRTVLDPPADRSALDRAYSEAMQALHAKYPGDADVGTLAAEAAMNLRPWDLYAQDGQPRPGTEAIVALLDEVLKVAPCHPLANHLYIHAVEASNQPGRAEAAADRLRDLQPGLSHNVHMPSHIDVRLGHWEAARDSNRKAIDADRRFLAVRPDPGYYGLYIAHNYHMLAYAAMMRGEGKVALGAIDEMVARVPESWARANAAIADGFLVMPLEVRMRFGRWDEILGAPDYPELFPIARALRHYARAVAHSAKRHGEDARGDQARFREARSRVPESATFGNNKASDLLAVAGHLMDGEILFREGRQDEGLAELREGVRRQDLLRYSEPPDWIQPVRHALGAALMISSRAEEAEAVYREDLKRLPENGWSLFGLARALEAQGKAEEAAKVRDRWERAWKDADTPLSSSCLCMPGP